MRYDTMSRARGGSWGSDEEYSEEFKKIEKKKKKNDKINK